MTLGFYFAHNVDATLNYGPLLENVTYAYLLSRTLAERVHRGDSLLAWP